MKKYMKFLVMAAVGVSLATGFVFTASAANVNQESVLTGQVVSVVPVGTVVKEGDVLVTVQSLTGPMPAARSTVNGVVTSVTVKNGDQVNRAQVVAVVDGK